MEDTNTKQPNTQPKKPRFLVRVLCTLLAILVVLGAVAVVVFRDRLSLDNIKRWIHYRSLVLNDSGQADSFLYDGSLDDTFAVLDGDLLVCSTTSISLFSGSGTQYVDLSVKMDNPVVSTNGSLAVVYDAGGSSLYVLGQREVIWSATDLTSILSAHLNQNGQLTVVSQTSGYKGTVTVYSTDYVPLMSVNQSSAYVMDAALSDDGQTLSILNVGQTDGVFDSKLSLYTLNTGDSGNFTPNLTCDLGSAVVLETRHTASQVWAVSEQNLSLTDHEGKVTTVDFNDMHLKRYSLDGDNFAVALLAKYRAGSQGELWVVSSDGTRQSMDIDQQVLSLSAAGRYIAVLTGKQLNIYTKDLKLYATLDSTQGARKVCLMEDGSAILISSDSASYYVP